MSWSVGRNADTLVPGLGDDIVNGGPQVDLVGTRPRPPAWW